MKSILDKSFRYTPSAATDVRKTFARARKQACDYEIAFDAAHAENDARNAAEAEAVVRPIARGRGRA